MVYIKYEEKRKNNKGENIMKKYELTNNFIQYCGRELYHIRALKNFNDVKRGDLGGYLESEKNLDHDGNCWVYDNAYVCDNALVKDNAIISGNARIHNEANISGNAAIFGNAAIYGNVLISDFAKIFDEASIYDNVEIMGHAIIKDKAMILEHAIVTDNAIIYGNAYVLGYAKVFGNGQVGFGFIYHGLNRLIMSSKDIYYIYAYFGIYPVNNEYILYKCVKKLGDGIYYSDINNLIFKDNEYTEESDTDLDPCEANDHGIFVTPSLYLHNKIKNDETAIAVKVHIDDFITCLGGALRAKKVFVIGEVENVIRH